MKPSRNKETETQRSENGKKSYHSPRILFREPIEVIAAFCDPLEDPAGKGDMGCPMLMS
jgi:hypothetical protein